MPLSYATFTGNSGSPQHTFTIPYNYILKDHIKVYYGRDILANTQTALLVSGTDYNFTSDTTIQLIGSTLNSGTTTGNPHNLANGVVLTLERDTPDSSQIVEFADGSNLIGDNLNNANLQNLFVVQEQQDKNDLSAAKAISSENAANTATNNVATLTSTQFKTDGSTPMTGDINANSNKIKNLADPTNAQDGVTKAYLERSGSITSTQIADGTIVDADINASANITGSKLQAASGSNPGSMSSNDKTKLDTIETSAKDDQTGAEIKSLYEGENDTNAFTDTEKSKLQNIESNAKDDQTGAEIKGLYEGESNTNAFTDAEQTKLANLDLTKLQNIEVNATQDQTAGEIKTLYESNNNTNPLTDVEKAVIDGVTANTSELNKLDGFTGDVNDLNQISGMSKQSSITNSASHFPTSAAVVNFVANQIAPVGGLEVIADEDSFPATQPVSGVVISISNADGLVINNAGEASNARTVGSGTDNVTIKNFPTSLRNSTLAANLGLLVSSTGASQEYNYHKLLAKESDVLQLSDDINDFAARYRVLNTLPSNSDSSNHDGDLVYAKDVGKIYVYSGDYNGTPVGTFGEVQSIGNFHISTLSPAFDGSTTAFTITNAPSNVAQILLSLNGVIQQPGTAFTLSGSTITFASAPPSGSTYFAVVLGSTVNIGTPSNNTITSAMIIDGSIVNGDISNSANIAGSKLNLVSTSSAPGLEVKGDGSSDGYLQLNCSQNSHGIKLKSPPHSAGASYTLTFPNNIVNGQFLKTDANGNLSWAAVDLTALSASNLTSGTIPDARFPSALPAIDGSALTGITQTTINNNAGDRLVTAENSANTLNAEANATFNGQKLSIGPVDGGADVVLSARNTASGGYGCYIQGGSGTNYILRLDDKDQNSMFRFNANGKLGIGTATPTGQIHLYQASNDPYIYIQRGSGDTAATIGGIFWKNSTNNLALIDAASTDINDGDLRFYTMGNGTLTEHMRIASNGEVGIGLTNPEAYGQNGNGSMGLVVEAPSGSYSAITIRSGYAGAGSLNFADGSGSNAERRNGFIDCDHVNKRLNIGLDGSSVARFTTHGFHPNPADSAAANAFDDYEIGSWSPTIESGTFTQYNQAWYIKIGKLVTCYFYIYNWSDNTSSTNFVIGGLPYAYNNSPKHESFCDVQHGGGGASFPSGVIGISGRIGQGTSTELELIIRYFNGTPRYMRHSDLGSVHLHTTFSYEAA